MKILGIIPSRYASSRFPGKPLCEINGKTMIRRVYEQTLKSKQVTDVIIATDDERIATHVASFNGRCMMTSAENRSGTERCQEVVSRLSSSRNESYDVIINIQGDEPFIDPGQIDELAGCFSEGNATIATLGKKITDLNELKDHNVVKVIMDVNSKAIYFSRYGIPYLRGSEEKDWLSMHAYFKHIGIYGYTPSALDAITRLPESALEQAESLEQLRWLENGFSITIKITGYESISVDVPADLLKITNKYL